MWFEIGLNILTLRITSPMAASQLIMTESGWGRGEGLLS